MLFLQKHFMYRCDVILLNWFFQAANVGFGRVFALVSDSLLKKRIVSLCKDYVKYSNIMVAGKARCGKASDWYHCFVDRFNN